MGVVTVDPPRLEDPIDVAVLAGPADVVHHRVAAILHERGADLGPDLLERLVPGDPLPLAGAPLAGPLHRVEDPLGVVDLVEGGWALGAVPAPAAGVLGVALDLGDLAGLGVEVGDEPAAGLAVEAGGGNDLVLPLDPVGPGFGVELSPVVPLVERGVTGQFGHRISLWVRGGL